MTVADISTMCTKFNYPLARLRGPTSEGKGEEIRGEEGKGR